MGYIGQKISDVAVTVGQGVIDATHIQDASITTADLGNDAVTPNKIDDDATGFQMGSLGLNSSVIGSDKFTLGGNATLKGDGSDQTLKWHNGSGYVNAKLDVRQLAVSFSGTDKLTSDTSGNFNFAGTVRIPHDTTDALRIGASDDLELWHNGTDSAVTNANTGKLYLWNYANSDTVIGSNNVESAVFTGANTTLRGTLTVSGNTTSTGNVLLNPSWSTTNIAFGSATTGHSSNNTGARIEVPLHATGGAAHGSFKFYTNSGDSANYSMLLAENGDISAQKRFYVLGNHSGSFGTELYNASSTGNGLKVRGGSTSSHYALFVSNYNQTNTLFQVLGDGQTQCTNTLKVNNDTEAIFRVQRGARYSEAAQNSSGGVITFYDSSGNMGAQISSYSTNVFNNDVKIGGAGTGVSRKLRFYTTNNVDDSKWIAVDENYYNVYHAHHNEGHLFRDQTGHLVKIFGNSGGSAETTFGTSSRNNNPRIHGNLRMNAANSVSFQNASANETVSLWNGGGSNNTVLYQNGGLRLTGTTNSATSGKGRGQIQATGNTALSASTNWTSVRTLIGDYQSGILIFHVQDTGNAANTRCQIYAFNADYYERGVNSIDNVTGGVAPGGIEVRIVRDDGSTTSDGGGPYTIQCRPANGTSSLGVRLLILSAGTD